jgi:DNA repair protein RadC
LTISFLESTTSKVKLLALRDRPAYRVSTIPSSCNAMEVLAAIISGPRQIEIAESLLAYFQGDIHRMFNACTDELSSIHGVGPQTATRIKAAFALSMLLNRPVEESPSVNSPSDAYCLLRDMETLEQEHLRVILLNIRMKSLGVIEVYIGAVNNIQIRLGEVFRPAIQRNASAIILAHNHPSSDPTPSPDDVTITRAAVQAGKLIDINVQDHLVIGRGGRYVSLKERGLGFS